MPLPSVQHIRDISFQDHFLSAQEAAPKNGKIHVNHNTFDVTFVDGNVTATPLVVEKPAGANAKA